MTKIMYTGSRLPKTVELPIPLMSKADKTGEIVFNPTAIVSDPVVIDQLLKLGPFVKIPMDSIVQSGPVDPIVVPSFMSARFRTKRDALAYINMYNIPCKLIRKGQRGWRLAPQDKEVANAG